MPDKLYTVSELAKMLSVTEWTVREWLKAGTIKGIKLNKQWRVTEESLEDYFRSRNG